MIDVSLPVHPAMLHGGPRPVKTMVETIAGGDAADVSRWLLSAHAGTHVEAPLHLRDGADAIEALPLDLLVGPATVLDLTAVTGEIDAADLVALLGDGGAPERLLLKTTNSAGPLQESDKADEWVGLAPDAAALLVERGVRVLGVDYLTVESPAREATFDAHAVLNGADVVVIESVDLRAVSAGEHELICLPLKLRGAEAAPARVVLVPASGGAAGAGAPIDISVEVAPEMLHWGRSPEVTVVESLAGGNNCNVTRWLMGSHTGTHLDAPAHYIAGGATIDAIALDVFAGPARVLDLSGVEGDVTAADLEAAGLGHGDERVLLRTANSASADGALRAAEKPATWTGLAPDGARLLVDRGVRLVGIDFLTIDGPTRTDRWESHHVLCGAGVVILECADLLDVADGHYELVALPIPLRGSEAAPGRAFLRPLGGD
ncbi:cyclase family protein [Conexibacter stalactiti]|uniref:Cyclase family protein n=1 Tax=Conexibacter stalactiti TaxID=1940611 RepID=A0ABU4HYG1_9ACTN|nr:cyclase family protein [Conexibacter stalactiti]MDW5598366.1 cyclase family protein [Conexibacter stalactiti]MEC5039008.1 cyclase family protein [Conexibacter stalactiti]